MKRIFLFLSSVLCLLTSGFSATPTDTATSITANGDYSYPAMRAGVQVTYSLSGTFGGGTATIGYISAAGAFTSLGTTFTSAGSSTKTLPEGAVSGKAVPAVSLSGAGSPSITVTITKLPSGSSSDVSAIAGLGTAATTAATAYAPSSIQAAQESLASTILFHDDCTGDNQTLTVNQTRTVEPGPGTMTAGAVTGSSLIRYEKGELILSVIGGTGNVNVRDSARTVSAGLTCIVRLVPSFSVGGTARNCQVGFSTSSTAGGMAGGAINLTQYTGNTSPTIQVSALTVAGDAGTLSAALGLFREGQEIALAVHHRTLTNQQYFMQGGECAAWGATLGSNNWIMLGESFADLTGVSVYPCVNNQFYGTTRVRNFKVLSSWSPSQRHVVKDFNTENSGTHCPALAKDPVSGLVVAAWNKGTSHTSADQTIRYSVRLASGAWTDAATLLAAGSENTAQQIGNLSIINGKLWLIYYTSPSATDGGTLYRRELTVASNGVITKGAATLLGITGTLNLAFNPAVTIPSGRIFLPFNVSSVGTYASYSDDNGITWSAPQILPGTGNAEPTFVVESDGGIGCIQRHASKAYYTRCADPVNTPTTWTSAVAITSIPQPGGSGSRMQYCKLASGEILLAGNDHLTVRRNITVWRMGDNGVVYGKVRLGDYNPELGAVGGTSILQYPAIIEDTPGNIITAFSRQPSAVGTSGIGIQIDARRWEKPVSTHAGGTGLAAPLPSIAPRVTREATILTYSTAPVPDMSFGERFYITLTASTAVIGAPLNPTPWQEITITFIQGGAGSFTATFNSVFEFGNITPTWLTAVSATNTLRAYYNPITAKWVVTSFT